MNWLVIVNLRAGNSSTENLWHTTEISLKDAGIIFSVKFTQAPAQTRLLASNAFNLGFQGVIVFGGDGTASDAAAALSSLKTKPLFAVLPAGSGNDWLRSTGFKQPSIDASIKAIAAENTQLIDAGICRWPGGSRFFLNSAGIGFDALVLKRATHFRRLLPFGKLNYLIVLAVSAFLPPHWRATISCDDIPFYKGDYFTLTTGIGRFSGGGMQLSPLAVADDGLLDCLVLAPMNLFTIARHIAKLFNGTLHKTKWATPAKGKTIRVVPSKSGSLLLELDGEVVIPGKDGKTEFVEFISLPANLRVIAPFEE